MIDEALLNRIESAVPPRRIQEARMRALQQLCGRKDGFAVLDSKGMGTLMRLMVEDILEDPEYQGLRSAQ